MPGLPIPTDLAAVDAAWLGAALGVDVVAVDDAGPTGGIAVTSRVARLRVTTAPPNAAPTRVVVKVTNPAWTHGHHLQLGEVRFYREFAPGKNLPTPACYYADADPSTGAFVLVLEDVGDVEPGHCLDGLDAEQADAVMDGIADLHRAWWQRDELTALDVRGHAPERVAQTVATFEQRWGALEGCGKYAIDDELRGVLPGVRARYADGMVAISSAPQTLVHTDLHVENFFLARTDDGGMRLIAIDWQNASYGNVAFDVSSVLTSVAPELVAGERERLLRRYHARLAAPDYPLERLCDDVAASLRHQFIGSANWFATFEAETLRDADTIQGHWRRLQAALIASERATE